MRKIAVFTSIISILLLSSCSTTSEVTSSSLETINIELDSEITSSSSSECTTQTDIVDSDEFYINLEKVEDLNIEGVMGDDRDSVEICIKLPRNYSDQKVNVYKVHSQDDLGNEYIEYKFPGWDNISFDYNSMNNGIYGTDDWDNLVAGFMNEADVDRLVESFEWIDSSKTPGYRVIGYDDKSYCNYAGYYESPASKYYNHKIILGMDDYEKPVFEKPFGVYSIREEIDGIPVGLFLNYGQSHIKRLPNKQWMAAWDANENLSYFNGEDIEIHTVSTISDYELCEENIPIIPLSEVIQNAFPAIKDFLITPLYGKRIRIYAAELAYLPYVLAGEDLGIVMDDDGESFADCKLVPFWVLYYQTDMSSEGYQREVVLINAITGEGVY